MKSQIKEKVRRFNSFEKELFVKMVQTFKAENCDMVEESFEDIEKLSELDRVELFNAVQKIEDLKGEKCLLTQKIRKEILNTTLIRRLDL